MQVADIMTTPVRTAHPWTTIEMALRLMAEHHVSSLPVVDEAEAVVGIVTEKDLLRGALGQERPTGRHLRETKPRHVADAMTRSPRTVTSAVDVTEVADIFLDTPWKGLPVVHHGRLIGMISRSDVVRALSRDDDLIQRDIGQLFTTAGHPAWRVAVTAGIADISGPSSPSERREAAMLAHSVVGLRRVRAHGTLASPEGSDV